MSDPSPFSARPASGAKSVTLTMLGEFVLPADGGIWTGTAIDGLAALGYSDRNARQALARLGDDGIIEPHRHGRRTRWHLTPTGERLLGAGAERIYRFGTDPAPWDGRWLVVICSIPETQREKRRPLQTQLAFAGFGFFSASIAISPRVGSEQAANDVLARLDLENTAVVLVSETGKLTPDGDLLMRSWDLDELAAGYEGFIDRFSPVNPVDAEAAFTQLTNLVHEWRQFPFVDPEFPPELLPAGWSGHVARHLFHDARRSWSERAADHIRLLEERHGG